MVMAPHGANPVFLGTRSGNNDMKLVTTVILHWRKGGQCCVVGGGAEVCQTSIGGVASTRATIKLALLVAIGSLMTKRDDNDFVGRWQGEGEGNQWPLHRAALNQPAAEDHRHRLPGWWLDNQQ